MVKKLGLLLGCLVIMPGATWAASCSRINLTRCLDSACAINLSANPAARCQYCGTVDAGLPTDSGLKSISAGTSSKNTISAKELKQAPTDPGERYVWATELCLAKVQNCTLQDVDDTYDPLIEKSCAAASNSSNMATLQKKAASNTKDSNTCNNEIFACITAESKCDSDFAKCSDDKQFDSFFATCSTQATGCTSFVTKVRKEIAESRKSTLAATSANIDAIVAARKKSREQKIASIKSSCSKNTDFDSCVTTACADNTNNNCATDAEKTIANNLCAFYKTACTKVK